MKSESILALISSYYTNFNIKSYSGLPVVPKNLKNSAYFQFSSIIENKNLSIDDSYKLFFDVAFNSGIKICSKDIPLLKMYIALSVSLNFSDEFCHDVKDFFFNSDIEDLSNKFKFLKAWYEEKEYSFDKEWVNDYLSKNKNIYPMDEYLIRKGILIGLSSTSFNDLVRSGLYLGIDSPIVMLAAYHIYKFTPEDNISRLDINIIKP